MKKLPALPKRFRLKDDEVIVILTPQKALKTNDGEPADGIFYSGFSPKQIKIAKHISRTRKWQTFFHELIHVLEEQNNLEIDHDVLDEFATSLYNLFINNNWRLPGE